MLAKRFLIVRIDDGEAYGVILDTAMTRRLAEGILFDLATEDTLTLIVDTDSLENVS